MSPPMDDPRRRRQQALARTFRAAAAVAFVLAVVGTFPGDGGRAGRAGMLAVVMGAPLLRVGWLAVRWWRRGDRRYTAVSGAVVGIIAAGAALAAL